jgi:ring-1,2-phenylacetyl-CoA epoxidase subunit PaaD
VYVVSLSLRDRAWQAASAVADPEIPVLTIADLGILREVTAEDGHVEVFITPTYSGCPAMATIALDIDTALARHGITDSRVVTVLSPAWTTDWMSEAGRRKLLDYGIAPPNRRCGSGGLFERESVACTQCGSTETQRLAEFGSTACKSLWRCNACKEPFDYFKCH